MTGQKLVVRYADGRLLKGYTTNFNPNAPHFLLLTGRDGDDVQRTVVELIRLKALFFVRDFAGNPGRRDRDFFQEHQVYQGRRIEVKFLDGETLAGATPNYDPEALGFFVFPADTESNTIKIFAINSSVKNVRFIQ